MATNGDQEMEKKDTKERVRSLFRRGAGLAEKPAASSALMGSHIGQLAATLVHSIRRRKEIPVDRWDKGKGMFV